MENNTFESTSISDILVNYNTAIKLASEKIKINNWKTNFTIDNIILDIKDFKSTISQNQRKKLRNKIVKVIKKQNLRSINALLNFVSKEILVRGIIYKVQISEKEETIQKLRKDWLFARDLAQQALTAYKAEKGDFYKKRV